MNDNHDIIGSGISGNKDVIVALISAVEEALMQQWMDTFLQDSMYQHDKKIQQLF